MSVALLYEEKKDEIVVGLIESFVGIIVEYYKSDLHAIGGKVKDEFRRAGFEAWERTTAHALGRVPDSPSFITGANVSQIHALATTVLFAVGLKPDIDSAASHVIFIKHDGIFFPVDGVYF